MSRRRIAIVQGHPDPRPVHFCHALAEAYATEAEKARLVVSRLEVAQLEFPLLRCMDEWDQPLPSTLDGAREVLQRADHLVLIFPLWLGTMPALLKAFLEQMLRPGFGFVSAEEGSKQWRGALHGKSARLIVTMGMPAFWYRLYFLAHGVRGLERNILKFCGVSPVRETFIGMVEQEGVRRRALARVRQLGRMGR